MFILTVYIESFDSKFYNSAKRTKLVTKLNLKSMKEEKKKEERKGERGEERGGYLK